MKTTKYFEDGVKISCISVLIFLLSFSECLPWTRTFNFDSGTTGQPGQSTCTDCNTGTTTLISSQVSESSGKSIEMYYTAGSTGDVSCYFSGGAAAVTTSGQGIWTRAYYYFGSRGSWTWQGNNSGAADRIKIMRLRQSSGGWLSIFGSTGSGKLRPSNEGFGNNEETVDVNIYNEVSVSAADAVVPTGRWVCLEQYAYAHATNGIHRIWKDGILVYQRSNNPTIPSGGSLQYMNAMGYVNQGFAANQYMAIDSIVFTTDIPSNRDTYGNPMIGPSNLKNSSDQLSAPKGLKTINNN